MDMVCFVLVISYVFQLLKLQAMSFKDKVHPHGSSRKLLAAGDDAGDESRRTAAASGVDEQGSCNQEGLPRCENARVARRRLFTAEETIEGLVRSDTNAFETHLPFLARMCRMVGHPAFVSLSTAYCALCLVIAVLDLARLPGRLVQSLYILGFSVELCVYLIIPAGIRGGSLTRPLFTNDPQRLTLYEVFDVLVKDLEGTCIDADGRRLRTVAMDGGRRQEVLRSLRWRDRVAGAVLGPAYVLQAVYFVVVTLATMRDNPWNMVLSISSAMVIVSLPTAMHACYVLSLLLWYQGDLFVSWLSTFRQQKQHDEEEALVAKTGPEGATAVGQEGEEEAAAVAALGESYRAIQLLRGKVSDSMGPLLSLMLCFALAAFIIPVGAYLALGSPKYVVLLVVSALGVICLVYFLLVLALANGFNDAVTTTPMHSSRLDYVVLGGRQEQLDFYGSTPAYWTVYGFAVTKTWLVATFSTVLSLVGAIVIQNVSASSGRR